MICKPTASCGKDHHLPQTIWRGRAFQLENGVMTDPFESDKKRELILSEHWMSTGIRPVSEKVLLPIVNRAPGTNDRHQEEAETHELRLDAMGATRKNANKVIDLTLHRRHARCYGLRPHLPRHRFRAGHRRRSPAICRFAPRGRVVVRQHSVPRIDPRHKQYGGAVLSSRRMA